MRYFVPFSLSLAVIAMSSCDKSPRNDLDEIVANKIVGDRVEVIKTKVLKISASAPQSIIYSEVLENKPKSDLTLNNESADNNYIKDNGLFTTTGNGGIGVKFDENNRRIPFAGIPLYIEKKHLEHEPSIVIESEGVTKTANSDLCKDIFRLNHNKSLIIIEKELIKGVTICKVKITASVDEDGKTFIDSGSFEVSLNKTYASFLKEGNKTAEYVKTYASINVDNNSEVLKKMSDYLNRDPHLNLDYDAYKISNEDDILRDLDALTGVQSIVSLSVAKTKLNNLDAVMLLPNLEHLDISETKIEPSTLSDLKRMAKLKSLSARNIDIKNLNNITKYIENLEKLDISDNKKINKESFDSLKNLKNLKKLTLRNIGLTHSLSMISNLSQLTSIDLSNNDLSKLTENDADILANLFDLKEINLSNTGISNKVLNYFYERISIRNSLEVFINRNEFDRNKVSDCEKVMIEESVPALAKLTNLKVLDLHGNSCRYSENGKTTYYGIQSTNLFSEMNKLETLNISNTVVSNLTGISQLGIKKIVLNELEKNVDGTQVVNYNKGIHLTANACRQYLGQTEKACDSLGKGSEIYKEFSPGKYKWTVPANVFRLTLVGASGANGGSGGGGSGASAGVFEGTWGVVTKGGNGGNGGRYNSVSQMYGSEGAYCSGTNSYSTGYNGVDGGMGGVGGITKVNNILFSPANEYADKLKPTERKKGGAAGQAGAQSQSIKNYCNNHGFGGAGGQGGNGWSSEIQQKTMDVTPGSVLEIEVGEGGKGGSGGQGAESFKGNHRLRMQYSGNNGASGQNGEDGFLRIIYEDYQNQQ